MLPHNAFLNVQNRCILAAKKKLSTSMPNKSPASIAKIAAPSSKNKKLSTSKSTQNTHHNLSKSLHPTLKRRSCQHPILQITPHHNLSNSLHPTPKTRTCHHPILQKTPRHNLSNSLHPTPKTRSCQHPNLHKTSATIVKIAAPYSKNKTLSASKSTQNTHNNLWKSLHPTLKTRSCQNPNLHKTPATICL